MTSNEKLVENEKRVRDWNQGAVKALKSYYEDEAGFENAVLEFVCECSDLSCERNLSISIKEYEKIHKRKNRFILARGHESPRVEKVTAKKQKFEIVEKPRLAK